MKITMLVTLCAILALARVAAASEPYAETTYSKKHDDYDYSYGRGYHKDYEQDHYDGYGKVWKQFSIWPGPIDNSCGDGIQTCGEEFGLS